MKKMKVFCMMALSLFVLAAGCGKEETTETPVAETVVETPAPTVEVTPEPIATPTPTPDVIQAEIIEEEPIPEGMAKSFLTGEYIPAELQRQRPVAVMINNVKVATPSSSTSKASVIYEAPVEGAITRMMAIFEDYSALDKIGSVRSCRDYFLDYAMGFDCIYVHYGQAVYALPYLESDAIDNLSGLAGYGEKVFYRTSDRKSPHNAYTSAAGIQAGIEHNGYRTTLREDYVPQFTFAWVGEDVTLQNGTDANLIKPGYHINEPWFEYNAEDGLYYRYQYGSAQMDEAFSSQLAVKNVIIQYTGWENYDENGYLNLYAGNGGKMQYFTNGKMVEGTWERLYEWGPEKYYDNNGNEITLNTGKTWVCVVLDSNAERVEIS